MSKMVDTHKADSFVPKAKLFLSDGYTAVGLYFFSKSVIKDLLTREVAESITDAGLWIVSVYENGFPTSGSYFTVDRATKDAHTAFARAEQAGQTPGSCIFFAVDYDAAVRDLPAIKAYFTEINRIFNALSKEDPDDDGDCDEDDEEVVPKFRIGVYGSGLVCGRLLAAGLVSLTWLSQSVKFNGYDTWKGKANIVQGPQRVIHGIDCDTDVTDGQAGGWRIENE